jgi:hypothetical protein
MIPLARTAGLCRRLAICGLLCVSLLGISADSSLLASSGTSESTGAAASRADLIKTAIVFNIAKFARWPESAFLSGDAPFRFCVLGDGSLGEALATIEGKRVHNHPLRTVLVSEGESASACHLLFVGGARAESRELLRELADLPILTVGEAPGFARDGGVINLLVVDKRNQFDVNVAAARRAGIELSAKLLRLARNLVGH